MENFNLLTTINGIYNFYNSPDDFNLIYNLLIYYDEYQVILKIKYKKLNNAAEINEGEIILNYTNYNELKYLLKLFNDNTKVFKNIIFNKFLDYFHDSLTFDIIY